jgi:hypothetical protein
LTKLIGLAGLKNSGKNTVGNFIEEWGKENELSVEQKGFADKVKWAAASIFWPGISLDESIEWANEFKNSKHACVMIRDADDRTYKDISGRELFQHVGTEMGRNIFGEKFWIDQLLDKEEWQYHWRSNIGVITDVRFPNEAARIKHLGGEIWNINRGLQSTFDNHISEKPLDRQYISQTINNLTSIEDLKQIVFGELEDIYAKSR